MDSSSNTPSNRQDSNENIILASQTSNLTSSRIVQNINNDKRENILCLICQNGRLGASFFNKRKRRVCVILDDNENSDYNKSKSIILQTKPSLLIIHAKQNSTFLKEIEKAMDRFEEYPNPASENRIIYLPYIQFNYDIASKLIFSTRWITSTCHLNDAEWNIYITTKIPTSNHLMIQSLGALLHFLEKENILHKDETRCYGIDEIGAFNLENVMFMDNNSYRSLNIFNKESHPSAYKSGSSKEGLSLFALMDRCKTHLGSVLLNEWFLNPTNNIPILNRRLDIIEYFLAPQNQDITMHLLNFLKNIKVTKHIFNRMRISKVSVNDWLVLFKTISCANILGEYIHNLANSFFYFEEISENFDESLVKIEKLMASIINFPQCQKLKKICLHDGLDDLLDEKREQFRQIPDLLNKIAEEELQAFNVSACKIVFLPQLGYLMAFPLQTDSTNVQDLEIDGLDFVYLDNECAHYKNTRMKELDVQLGDINKEINDLEGNIINALEKTILTYEEYMVTISDVCGELDCLLSMTFCAHDFDLVKPLLSTRNIIHIQKGRHLIQELCSTQIVANDTFSCDTREYCDKDKWSKHNKSFWDNSSSLSNFETKDARLKNSKIKVLTGAHGSGKSIYIKQIGLIVFMAHIGSYVPAQYAEIGPIDQIFTRIHSYDTVSNNHSMFMMDIAKVSQALNYGTENSLVLLDEIGKGTVPEDGIALLAEILNYYCEMPKCPFLFVITHFLEIPGLLVNKDKIAFQTMEIIQDLNKQEIIYLYRLVDGFADNNHIKILSKSLNFQEKLIDRALEISKWNNAIPLDNPKHNKVIKDIFKRFESCYELFQGVDLNDDIKKIEFKTINVLSDIFK